MWQALSAHHPHFPDEETEAQSRQRDTWGQVVRKRNEFKPGVWTGLTHFTVLLSWLGAGEAQRKHPELAPGRWD